MKIDVITLFPELVASLQHYGVVGRALQDSKVELELTNPRDFTQDSNHRVDDRPYGGGPGMVMQFDPLSRALNHIQSKAKDEVSSKVVYLSPQGQRLNQQEVRRLGKCQHMILLCGRYEGIDERFIETRVDEEWSLGDYVISGGELAAMVLIDAITRTIPGVLGDDQSAEQDSFESGLLDYPHYTRPESIAGNDVPEELLSGDHQKIEQWRIKQALGRTFLRRPDLIEKYCLSEQEQHLLNEYLAEHKAKNKR